MAAMAIPQQILLFQFVLIRLSLVMYNFSPLVNKKYYYTKVIAKNIYHYGDTKRNV